LPPAFRGAGDRRRKSPGAPGRNMEKRGKKKKKKGEEKKSARKTSPRDH